MTSPLSPDSDDSPPPRPRPTQGEILSRAMRLRCPRCGEGRLFRTFLRMPGACPVCGLGFERAPGYYLGSAYINYGVTAACVTATFLIGRIFFHVPGRQLLWPLFAFCLVFPVLMFRHARALWLALDCQVDSTVLEEPDLRDRPPHVK